MPRQDRTVPLHSFLRIAIVQVQPRYLCSPRARWPGVALVNTISRISSVLNPNLQIEGLLRTMYDPRNSLTLDVSAQLSAHFGDKLYQTVIPRNVRLAEAPSFGMPALAYDKQSRGAVAYLALAGEVVRRSKQAAKAAAVTDLND